MTFFELPATAAWRHEQARSGFEVAYFSVGDGLEIEGLTTAVEDGVSWAVSYRISLDSAWRTRSVRLGSRSVDGPMTRVLESDGAGNWLVDGVAAPSLAGCLDVDLESSALTNAFPVHRLDLPLGAMADAPAVYVRAVGLGVDRLDQTYRRIADREYAYRAPAFDWGCELGYDEYGLLLSYPGLAVRVA